MAESTAPSPKLAPEPRVSDASERQLLEIDVKAAPVRDVNDALDDEFDPSIKVQGTHCACALVHLTSLLQQSLKVWLVAERTGVVGTIRSALFEGHQVSSCSAT